VENRQEIEVKKDAQVQMSKSQSAMPLQFIKSQVAISYDKLLHSVDNVNDDSWMGTSSR
jgi:hypothetical protein